METTITKLKKAREINRKLEEENIALREENARLKSALSKRLALAIRQTSVPKKVDLKA